MCCGCPYCPLHRCTELLGSADLAPGSGLSVRATGVKSCEGEASRQNKDDLAWLGLAAVAGKAGGARTPLFSPFNGNLLAG